jgi:hypothetical protein
MVTASPSLHITTRTSVFHHESITHSFCRKMMSAAAVQSRSSSSSGSIGPLPPPPLVHVGFSFDRTQFGRMHDALLRLLACPRLLLPPHLMDMSAGAATAGGGVLARHAGGWATAEVADKVRGVWDSGSLGLGYETLMVPLRVLG